MLENYNIFVLIAYLFTGLLLLILVFLSIRFSLKTKKLYKSIQNKDD